MSGDQQTDSLPVHVPHRPPSGSGGGFIKEIAPWFAVLAVIGGAVKYTNDSEGRIVAMQEQIKALSDRQLRAEQNTERRFDRVDDRLERLLARPTP